MSSLICYAWDEINLMTLGRRLVPQNTFSAFLVPETGIPNKKKKKLLTDQINNTFD